MTKAQLNAKPKKTLVLMATLKRVYKGGKKTAEKKSKAELVSSLFRAYGGKTNKRSTPAKAKSTKTVKKVTRRKSVGKLDTLKPHLNKYRYSCVVCYMQYRDEFYIIPAPIYINEVIAQSSKLWRGSSVMPDFYRLKEGKLSYISKKQIIDWYKDDWKDYATQVKHNVRGRKRPYTIEQTREINKKLGLKPDSFLMEDRGIYV